MMVPLDQRGNDLDSKQSCFAQATLESRLRTPAERAAAPASIQPSRRLVERRALVTATAASVGTLTRPPRFYPWRRTLKCARTAGAGGRAL